MAAVTPSPLPAILAAVRDRLASVTEISPDLILFRRSGAEPPHFNGDHDLVVRIGPPNPVSGFSHGSGRVAGIVSRSLSVTVRSRLSMDMSDRDNTWMLDTDSGHFPYEEAVVDALHGWFPQSTSQDILTVEPLHWVPSGSGAQDNPANQSVGWGETTLAFECQYQLPLSVID